MLSGAITVLRCVVNEPSYYRARDGTIKHVNIVTQFMASVSHNKREMVESDLGFHSGSGDEESAEVSHREGVEEAGPGGDEGESHRPGRRRRRSRRGRSRSPVDELTDTSQDNDAARGASFHDQDGPVAEGGRSSRRSSRRAGRSPSEEELIDGLQNDGERPSSLHSHRDPAIEGRRSHRPSSRGRSRAPEEQHDASSENDAEHPMSLHSRRGPAVGEERRSRRSSSRGRSPPLEEEPHDALRDHDGRVPREEEGRRRVSVSHRRNRTGWSGSVVHETIAVPHHGSRDADPDTAPLPELSRDSTSSYAPSMGSEVRRLWPVVDQWLQRSPSAPGESRHTRRSRSSSPRRARSARSTLPRSLDE